MSWANRITIFRVLMIPLFVTLMIYYGKSTLHHAENDWLRIAAVVVFVVAASSDAVDGYLARHYNQRSRLGTFLDPIADKALLVSAIVLLTVDYGDAFDSLPAWFAVTVISRDVLLMIGAIVIQMVMGDVTVRPRMMGKIATVSQMAILGWTMFKVPSEPRVFWQIRTALLVTAGMATVVSGLWYMYDGARQLSSDGKPKA